MVLAFTFRSLTHFEFIKFMYGVRQGLIHFFFLYRYLVVSAPFVASTCRM